MGDSGALTLGFLLAVMSLHGSIKNAATVAILVPILTLGLPVIDALLVMTVRLAEHPRGPISGRLARVFRADSNHLHHLMMEGAPERRAVVVALYLVAAAFCAMALVVGLSRSGPLGAALVLVEIAVVLLMRKMRVQPPDLARREEGSSGTPVPEHTTAPPPAAVRAASARAGARQ
jgi:UDP-GlcNAc:undecaprenyl-phosphate GlcNAc-1-phosphate transferase